MYVHMFISVCMFVYLCVLVFTCDQYGLLRLLLLSKFERSSSSLVVRLEFEPTIHVI